MIKEAASEEPYMGEQMPLRWLRFEQEIAKLVAGDTTHASYDQVWYNSKSTLSQFSKKNVGLKWSNFKSTMICIKVWLMVLLIRVL